MDDGVYILRTLIDNKFGGYEYRINKLNGFHYRLNKERILKLFETSKVYFSEMEAMEEAYELIMNSEITEEGILMIKMNWVFNDIDNNDSRFDTQITIDDS